MADLLTHLEPRAIRAPEEIGGAVAAREVRLSRLLTTYITTGLIFMLLPGTFLGVWNLIAISGRQAADSVSPAWIQAHGHAQIFGWIGTFILGIGFYSIPKLRRLDPFALSAGWSCWALWTAGVAMRWWAGVAPGPWRVLLPVSAALELAAYLIFLRCVSGHRPEGGKSGIETWAIVVIAASFGLLLTLLVHFGSAVWVAVRGTTPALSPAFDQQFLVLETWGFLVPFVWGFSAKWLPVFLGLRPVRNADLMRALTLNAAGVLSALAGWMVPAVLLLEAGMIAAVFALGILEHAPMPAKTKGVSARFPFFVRLAYMWGIVAATLGIWAALAGNSSGIWGASRHALTVGFLAMMVFAIGQRVLPTFLGMKVLFSTRLMSLALTLLAIGCLMRVTSEILAYQGFSRTAWHCLPISAVVEMTAVTLFAFNLWVTVWRNRSSSSGITLGGARSVQLIGKVANVL